jgi:hypothetical protein
VAAVGRYAEGPQTFPALSLQRESSAAISAGEIHSCPWNGGEKRKLTRGD